MGLVTLVGTGVNPNRADVNALKELLVAASIAAGSKIILTDGTDDLLINSGGSLNAMIESGAGTGFKQTVDSGGLAHVRIAGSSIVLNVAAAADSGGIYEGSTLLQEKTAVVNASTNGDNTIVAAVPSKKIAVTGGILIASGAVTARLQDGAAGSYCTGPLPLVANTGFAIPVNPRGYFRDIVSTNTLLNMELNAAVTVSGWLTYIEII